jgi:MFS family permease
VQWIRPGLAAGRGGNVAGLTMDGSAGAPPGSEHAALRAHNGAIILGFVLGFVGMAHRSGFGVLYPAVVADQGWSVGEVTNAFSYGMLVYAPAAVLTGQFVDRLGVRATMLLGIVMLVLGLLLTGLARESWQFVAVYAVTIGVGANFVGYIPMMKLMSLRAGTRLGFGLGVFNAGQGIGALVVSPVLQLLVNSAGWRLGFAALAALALVTLVPLTLASAPGRAEHRAQAQAAPGHRLAGIWRLPNFWLMFLVNTSLGYLLLLPVHHVAHLIAVGVSAVEAASIGGLMGACIGIGALLGGLVVDRLGVSRLGLAGATVMSLGVVALIICRPETAWLALGYVLAGGLGRGALGVASAAFQARTFAGASLGRVSGLLDLGFGLGASLGPMLTALSFELTGGYGLGLATAIVAGFAAAGAVLRARRLAARPTVG